MSRRSRVQSAFSFAHVAASKSVSYITANARPNSFAAARQFRSTAFVRRSFQCSGSPGRMAVAKRWTNAPSISYSRIQRKCRRTVSGWNELKTSAALPSMCR